ncbi:efflux RND transporter periplasmic adaptor subunit [Adhaeretor mobilis]|uniref:Multidrug efflux system subunit MdtA n=1 Tax=Adhaeretor mobilis TaxID=1930276 RepID=A0A517MTY7_9BACT|nr:efflux RND transporter periplasmic adaptor subunit [Adhaeretor mobilis]QDS98348.1 multidrug efflux system subunit MdtA [Adhaeretor mobilis]
MTTHTPPQNSSQTTPSQRRAVTPAIIVGLVLLTAAGYFTQDRWLPLVRSSQVATGGTDHVDPHAGHDHGAASATASVDLSDKGLKNIGFVPFTVEASDYERSLTLPAIVVERPGRSQIHITAPFTGNISAIHAVDGEAVDAGDELFDLELTHEELVVSQRDYLKTLANLKIAEQEISRLESLGEGVVAGKRVLEQKYEKQKLEVALRADEQAMLLHGLSEEQIADIRTSQRLFRSLKVHAPQHSDTEAIDEGHHLFTVQRLKIARGEQVEAGQELAVLSDHCELHVEGLGFADDAAAIRAAAKSGKEVSARLLNGDTQEATVKGLELLNVADQIDPTSRALKAYLRLPNEVALDRNGKGKRRFLEWRYKPGQRMQIHIPVETWENQIVLPPTALAEEGAENYVYRQNGDHFDQIAVHVLHREQDAIVVANDGALFPGDVIAGKGAYQMHLALKNKSGGAIDPHAGHNH